MMRVIVPLVFLALAFLAFVIWRFEAWARHRAQAKITEAEARERYAEKLIAGTTPALPIGFSDDELRQRIQDQIDRELGAAIDRQLAEIRQQPERYRRR